MLQPFQQIPLFRNKETKIPETSFEELREGLRFLNNRLNHQHNFAAGTDRPTVADYALVTNVSSYEALGISLQDFPNVQAWHKRCKDAIEGWEELDGNLVKEAWKALKALLKDQ